MMKNSTRETRVVLVTADPRLLELVRARKPSNASLHVSSSGAGVPASVRGSADQWWIDLDLAEAHEAQPSDRTILFYSSSEQIQRRGAWGLSIRKPCSPSIIDLLWAGTSQCGNLEPSRAALQVLPPALALTENGADRDSPGPAETPADAAGWILDFLDLNLQALCRKIAYRAPALLGYEHAVLYLHDVERALYTLAAANSTQSRDLALSRQTDADHMIVAAALRRDVIGTRDVRQLARRNAWRGADALPEKTPAILAPLIGGSNEVEAVLLAHGPPKADAAQRALTPHQTQALALLGCALRHAKLYERVRVEARVDALTGLFNYRWMVESLKSEIERTQRYRTTFSLAALDIDGLKKINDQHGHLAGDEVLRHVARCIQTGLRQIDRAARVGGDEFVVLLPGTDARGAKLAAGRMAEALRCNPPCISGASQPVHASVGVAHWERGWDATRLLRAADQALYATKRANRDAAPTLVTAS